ncbi:type VII secretion protein EccB [Plantactinospora sp. KLBMP9567]|uniref:type VII secretion protein EccB n=1 Tax=Plantactinospora sp. KLBMP9567 TaxID=3085900 RepID=UPI002980BA91|nr:type VII secretion protein EccB [Plantactinospora sp. KLBMP9567]MDW5327702.1 type VII secretion protein EccB [Plantactinospora sp. KLBMP9567]MDW5329170.1 type VII secretion protein EccB [Plantactinospora sp. KLBMP9567]
MPSRQDQLHSYQFMVQRVVGALVMRETDPAQSPFRRAAGATLASVLIALIGIGGSVVYGVFVGGGATKWKDSSVVIVEKESGAQYVYVDNTLHPVLNYASALLIVGQPAPKTVSVSRKSLEGQPRGVTLGIRDLPESLAPSNRLVSGGWTICSEPRTGGGGGQPQSTLLVGRAAPGGQELGDEGLLAEHPNGQLFLIWHNRRHLIQNPELVVGALWGSQRQVAVAPALLNALPAGADLGEIRIPDAGEPSDAVDGAKIGQVFLVERQGGDGQYAVARRDGLYNITEVQANILLTTDAVKQGDATRLSQGQYGALPKKGDLVPGNDAAAPADTPEMATAEGGVICGDVPDDRGVQGIRIGADMSGIPDPPATSAQSARGGALADQVVLEPGRGVVVEAAAAPGATGGAISIVTDQGRRHPVTSGEVLGNLGYAAAKRVRMPSILVTLIPDGPALDPEKARDRAGVQ